MSHPGDRIPASTFRRPGRGGGRTLLGVCAGLARRWDLEASTVRLAFLITLVPFGAGLLVYAALAVVMPADGASDRAADRRGELARALAQALVVLAGVFAIGLIAAASTALAVFGLASVALLLATALLALIVVGRHERLWILGVAVLALAVPAAVAQLTDVTVARQGGRSIVTVSAPSDVGAAGYRAGTGPMLLDLRRFDAPAGTTTAIRARADLRPLVVALPTDRCVNLVVDYGLDRTWVGRLVDHYAGSQPWIGSDPGYVPARLAVDTGRVAPIPALVAFGDATPTLRGRYTRPVGASGASGASGAPGRPGAPTIHLTLSSGRSQLIVRDFPARIDPLSNPTWPATGRRPESLLAIARRVRSLETGGDVFERRPMDPRATAIEVDPTGGQIVSDQTDGGRIVPRTAVNRKLATMDLEQLKAVQQTAARLLRRERWVAEQARRLAGACASPAVVQGIALRLGNAMVRETKALAPVGGSSPIVRLAAQVLLQTEIGHSAFESPVARRDWKLLVANA